MRFPADMVEAIGAHHSVPAEVPGHMGRVLIAADAIAIEIDHIETEENCPIEQALDALDIPAAAAESLLDEVRSDQDNLAGFLTVR